MDGYLVPEPTPAIWVHFLALQKSSHAALGRSLHQIPPFSNCDQNCLGATGLETSQGPMDQLHEGPSSISQQPGAAAGKQNIPAELGREL